MDLLAHSPQFDSETSAALALQLFGIRAEATSLPSERDQNFLLVNALGERFVLKIANSLESRSLLEAQNLALTHLSGQLNSCPKVITSHSNAPIEAVESTAGSTHLVRLLTYLPGVPLGEVKDQSLKLLHNLGSELGRLDRALSSFDHPALHRDFHWDLANGLRVIRDYESLIANKNLRQLISAFADNFEREFVPLLPQLRRSVIHGDANDFNILVNDDRIVGLIDFGDMVHSYVVAELAVAIAYAVLGKADPLAVASTIAAGYDQQNPLTEIERQILWPLVLMRLCMSVCLAAEQQRQQPDNQYLRISQTAIETSLPGLMKLVRTNVSASQTLLDRKNLLGQNLSIAYKDPIKVVRGAMQYLYDHEGRQYLDAYNNVAHVGHCHPKVVQAGQQQMAQLNTNTRYLHDTINHYAERLTSTLPASLKVCFFVNSGGEANELALRLARAHTKTREIIVLDHAYHGNTTTLIDISPYKHDGPGGDGPPGWVHKVPLPDVYRGVYRGNDPQASAKYAQHVSAEIGKLQDAGLSLSAFIAESLPSVAGQIVLPDGYLSKVYEAVRGAGGVCIADEVQTGYGRIGSHLGL